MVERLKEVVCLPVALAVHKGGGGHELIAFFYRLSQVEAA